MKNKKLVAKELLKLAKSIVANSDRCFIKLDVTVDFDKFKNIHNLEKWMFAQFKDWNRLDRGIQLNDIVVKKVPTPDIVVKEG